MKRELTEKQKEQRTQIIINIALLLFFLLFSGTMVLFYLNDLNKEKVDDLASQYTVSGNIEKVIIKKVEGNHFFELDAEEYYVLVNKKRYKLPSSFTDDVHEGSQVTLTGDRNGVSTIEIEK